MIAMDISVIIPVYNSEKYLSRCLDSVVAALGRSGQTGELLLVDNNSSDKSAAILREYHNKYPELIKVHQCKTPGAAATRNLGVSKARGEFIWFVDADDEIVEDAIGLLIEEARGTGADLTMLGLTRIYKDGHRENVPPVLPTDRDYKSKYIRSELGQVQVLIRRSWWLKHDFKFHEGIIHEDMELMPSLILFTDKFAAVDKILYLYYQNDDSVLHKLKFDPHYFDIFTALESLYARFEKAGAAEEYHDELEWFFIWNLLVDSAKYFAKFKEARKGFRMSRRMLRQYFPNWRKNRFLNQKKISWKLRVLVNLSYFGIVK